MTKSKAILHNLMKPFKLGSNKDTGEQGEEDLEKIAAKEQKQFAFETLVSATNNFHSTNKLGEGGFGAVYKGKLDDGREIAVKRFSLASTRGTKEFTNGARLLTRFQHRNVVNTLGYCSHGTEKLLVYEYVANESLDKLLFESNSSVHLDWKQRHDIITGVSRGLHYLHEDSKNCIVHRNIKASNVLLDDKWLPKITDFGMEFLFPDSETQISTRVAGTNGYMAPEYAMHGCLSVKADVFSFGVLVLELITGKRNSMFSKDNNSQNLLEWAYKLHRKGKSLEIMDPTLANSALTDQVKACIHIALLCVQSDPQERPDMHRVVVMLSKRPINMEEPNRPGMPGSRYRRRHRPTSSSSAAQKSSASDSYTLESTSNTTTIDAAATSSGTNSTSPHSNPW